MEIVFACAHCGKNLVVDEAGQGHSVECPACGKPVIIPVASGRPQGAKRMVVRIPSSKPGGTPAERAAPPVPGQLEVKQVMTAVSDSKLMEIVVGWVCVVVGTLLAVLLPRAFLVYAPFFVGAIMMAVVLLKSGRVLQGIVLLLCTCIPPPLLTQQSIWRNVHPSASRAAPESVRVQKLVFDSTGKSKLVTTDEPLQPARAVARAPESVAVPAPARASAPKPRRLADEVKAEIAPPPVSEEAAPPEGASSSDPFASSAPPPELGPSSASPGGEKSVDEMYKELLEGQAEVPPLVPEDVLESTVVGHDEDFRWQKKSLTDGLMPGDPAPVVDVPFAVYKDGGLRETYSATGRLGNKDSLRLDDSWDAAPHSGKTCIRVVYEDYGDWATAAWQNPGNNWGDFPGGFDLSNASKLTFWAKGESGGEEVEFMVGMEQGQNAVSRDTLRASSGIVKLRKEWKRYTIPLEKMDRAPARSPGSSAGSKARGSRSCSSWTTSSSSSCVRDRRRSGYVISPRRVADSSHSFVARARSSMT